MLRWVPPPFPLTSGRKAKRGILSSRKEGNAVSTAGMYKTMLLCRFEHLVRTVTCTPQVFVCLYTRMEVEERKKATVVDFHLISPPPIRGIGKAMPREVRCELGFYVRKIPSSPECFRLPKLSVPTKATVSGKQLIFKYEL